MVLLIIVSELPPSLCFGTPPGEENAERSERGEAASMQAAELAHALSALSELRSHNAELLAELSRHAQILARLSKQDPLTGLHNRRFFDETLALEFARMRRLNYPLSVVMADVDGLRRVNVACSHAIGDQVLCGVADALAHNLRGMDVLARYGGEEFALLLPGLSAPGALSVCERLQLAVRCRDWSALHPGLEVTISLGVCDNLTLPSPERLLAAADEKLLEAKRLGTGRISS